MKQFNALCHRVLTWLMVGTVAVLIVPVSLQIFSRFTQLIRLTRDETRAFLLSGCDARRNDRRP